MNQTQCSNCQSQFDFDNPPKKLKNCLHNLCDLCLSTIPKCPIDGKKIDYRKYTAKAFQIDHDLLDFIEQQTKNQIQPTLCRQRPKRQDQICLLHSKPVDLICSDDGASICANCALFGEHKGHNIKNITDFMNELTNLTQQVLGVFDQMKEKQQNLNTTVINEYITDCFRQKRSNQVKLIKSSFSKLIQKIRKIEKVAISNLDIAIKAKKEELLKEVSISELECKKNQWYSEVERLGTVTEEVYQLKEIKQGIKYLNEQSSEGYIMKKGEYLRLEYESAENSIKSRIDQEVNNLKAEFDEEVQRTLDQYCYFGKKVLQIKTPINQKSHVSSNQNQQKNCEEDILLEGDTSIINQYKDESHLITEQKVVNSNVSIKIPEVTITKSIQPMPTPKKVNKSAFNSFEGKIERRPRSKSRRKKNVSNVDDSSRDVLGSVNENKRRKKIEIPEKYKAVFQDLRSDRSQTIDFGGAELGDNIVLHLCQWIGKSTKLRNLKLIRNKLTDQVIYQLLNACYKSKITSLNLSQNSLTERSFQLFEKYDLGQIRNITLSLNKINRRHVKQRLDEFIRRGITMSI